MALSTQEQLKNFLAEGASFAVVCGLDPTWDSLSAGLALAQILSARGQQVNLYFSEPTSAPKNLQNFWPAQNNQSSLEIILDMASTGLDSVQYQVVDNNLRILVAPKTGRLEASAVTIKSPGNESEKIIAIGLPDFEAVSKLVAFSASSWLQKQIVNLDTNPANESYGAVNWVEPASGSVCQMVAQYLLAFHFKEVTAEVASLLAYGLMQSGQRTHKRLWDITSDLLNRLQERGAKLLLGENVEIKDVATALSLPSLQIWGKVLARLKKMPLNFWLSALTAEDLAKAQMTLADLNSLEKNMTQPYFENMPMVILVQLGEGEYEAKILGPAPTDLKIVSGPILAQSFKEAYQKIISGF